MTEEYTVGKLIERLQEFDPNTPVGIMDRSYGFCHMIAPKDHTIEMWESSTQFPRGKHVVVID